MIATPPPPGGYVSPTRFQLALAWCWGVPCALRRTLLLDNGRMLSWVDAPSFQPPEFTDLRSGTFESDDSSRRLIRGRASF